ncbi:MAG: baseplate J/gp47 family protein [Pseudomonadota bacterium]
MAFTRPDLPTLINRAEADIETRLPGADARLRRSNLNVLARVHSGAAHGLYGYLEWISRQVIIDTADGDMLERHASIWGVERKAASPAVGNITVTGSNGAIIPVDSTLARSDGAQYTTDAEATIAGGTATIAVTAVEGGQAGNASAASSLSFATPIAGVSVTATVDAGGLTGGADIETDDDLRARLLARIQAPPHGGAQHDYVAWALEVAGVTRAWVYPAELGLGTVTVRFVRDDDASPIPDAGEVAAVQAYIDSVRPVTADVTVVAPIAVPLNFTIDIVPDTAAIRAAIEAELRDLLRREAEPGATILLSHIREAISLAAGENDHILSVPAANVTHAVGEMATFGAITWL